MRVQPAKIDSILSGLCCEEGVTLAENTKILLSTKFNEENDSEINLRSGERNTSQVEEYVESVDVFSVTDSLGRRLLGVLNRRIDDRDVKYTAECFVPESSVDPFWKGDPEIKRTNGNGGRKKVVLFYDRKARPFNVTVLQDHELCLEIDSQDNFSEYSVVIDQEKVGKIRKAVRREYQGLIEKLGAV
jgi:hypothetical protein